MKKTLLVTIDFPPAIGGVANYWKQVCQSIPELVVLTVPSDFSPWFSNHVIRKPLFFKWLWPYWLKGVWQIYRVYKQEKCQQILVGQILPVGSMVYLLYRLFKFPYIVQVYGMDLLKAKEHKRKHELAKKVLLYSEKILVNSQAVASVVQNYTSIKLNSQVVYPVPLPPQAVNRAIKEKLLRNFNLKDKKIILTVGRLVERKGQDKTIEAMIQVWKTHPNSIYVIVGDGSDRHRLESIALPYGDKIIFTGEVSNEERNFWFSVCDIFVMPSRHFKNDIEGFGTVFLEAGFFGKPVIGGNSGGVAEAVLNKVTGLLVNPEDVNELALAIIKLLSAPDYAKKLGVQGKQRLEKELDWKNEVDKIIKGLMTS